MEQCSSEATALYKRNLSLNSHHSPLTSHPSPPTSMMVDLTGGFGVDFSFMARNFDKAIYVERQEHLCDIARENFQLLGLSQAEVVCGDAEEFLETMPHMDVVYLDPARRDTSGARTFAIGDCTPNVIALRDKLLRKADRILLKLSPMLDWRKAVSDLGEKNVSEVHVVSVNNECKELLIVMTAEETVGMKVVGVDIEVREKIFEVILEGRGEKVEGRDYCTAAANHDAEHISTLYPLPSTLQNSTLPKNPSPPSPLTSKILYSPNSSIMKIGCFEEIEERFGVCQVARNSHLFLSDHEVEDFPGRAFNIVATTTMNKRELKTALANVRSANIAVRNFPLSVAELRKRLKLKDGGETYIFATTDADNQHRLYICRKTEKKVVKE